jgi:predicted metal-dependent hydrolase
MLPLRQMLFGTRSPLPAKPLEPLSIDIEGCIYSVSLKRHATARRMVLRLARDGESFVLTLPKRQSVASAKSFLETSRVWMQNILARSGRKTETSDTLILRGVAYALLSTGKARGLVQCDDDAKTISVPGAEAHRKRRLIDWLKHQAENDLRIASHYYETAMQTRFTKVTLRDQKSRWGSCTTDGALSYSWRLVLAPRFVLDYVAAHEVAHLLEMNHGPRFWRLVLTHCPRTREAKQWLKSNGHTLHHGV